MKIIGIEGKKPSKRVSNQDIIDLINHYSKESFSDNLPSTLMIIDKLFERSGIKSRYWLEEDEHPMTLMKTTFNNAMAQANIRKEDIDLLIYSSVSRGFTEPANSTFVAKALGLTCRNYDVVDACMGWVSSMKIINDTMKAGAIRYAVIVNMEFAASIKDGPGIPKNFSLGSISELAYKFPTFTIGEAVTVTILGNELPDNFKFTFINRPELCDLCTISLPGWRFFCNDTDTDRIAPTGGQFQFNSHGREMHETGILELVNVFNQHNVSKNEIECVFTHTSSPKHWAHAGQLTGLADKIYSIGEETGNVITASVPLAIADAAKKGVLKENQVCLSWTGSAGMVFSAMTFVF